LRARSERPRRSRAADERHEIPAPDVDHEASAP
jgi:hypothetical protein